MMALGGTESGGSPPSKVASGERDQAPREVGGGGGGGGGDHRVGRAGGGVLIVGLEIEGREGVEGAWGVGGGVGVDKEGVGRDVVDDVHAVGDGGEDGEAAVLAIKVGGV